MSRLGLFVASGIRVGAGGGSSCCDEEDDDEVVEFGFSLVGAPGAVAFLSAESLPVCGIWFQLVPNGGFFCGRVFLPSH